MSRPITLADARFYAGKLMTYFGRAIFSLQPIERKGFGTFAVDKYWRLYYDPELLDEWSLDELSGVCLLYTSPSPRDLSTSRMPSSA